MSGEDFATLGAPARRALANAGIGDLEALAQRTRIEVARLHGMGPSTLPKLDAWLAAKELSWRAE